jgi:hypothetical protein
MVSTSLTDGQEILWDSYITEFERVVNLAEEILAVTTPSYSAGYNYHNGFKLDMGIIPPLYFTAMKCRDPFIRRRAIQALSDCKYQEGAWDGQTMVGLARSVVQVEERGLGIVRCAEDVPESNRLYRAWYDLTVDGKILYCKRREFENHGAWIDYVEDLNSEKFDETPTRSDSAFDDFPSCFPTADMDFDISEGFFAEYLTVAD